MLGASSSLRTASLPALLGRAMRIARHSRNRHIAMSQDSPRSNNTGKDRQTQGRGLQCVASITS